MLRINSPTFSNRLLLGMEQFMIFLSQPGETVYWLFFVRHWVPTTSRQAIRDKACNMQAQFAILDAPQQGRLIMSQVRQVAFHFAFQDILLSHCYRFNSLHFGLFLHTSFPSPFAMDGLSGAASVVAIL